MNKKKVLFLCTGNSCRSQMAQGWATHLIGDLVEAYSAGTKMHGLNPRAVQVMKDAGVDISSHYSKTTDDLANIKFDIVVTVCKHAHENCPVFSGHAKIIHKKFDDPPFLTADIKDQKQIMQVYRRVRDEIRDYIKTMPTLLNK